MYPANEPLLEVYKVYTFINNMAHNKKIEKGPHKAKTSLSCAYYTYKLCIVLVIVYKNDPPPTLRNISRAQKAVQSILIRIINSKLHFAVLHFQNSMTRLN